MQHRELINSAFPTCPRKANFIWAEPTDQWKIIKELLVLEGGSDSLICKVAQGSDILKQGLTRG